MDFNSVSCDYCYQLVTKIISNEEERNMEKKYKLKVYKVSGKDKGNLDHEELFETKKEMDDRYLYFLSYRIGSEPLPTAWEKVDGEWERLLSY